MLWRHVKSTDMRSNSDKATERPADGKQCNSEDMIAGNIANASDESSHSQPTCDTITAPQFTP